MIKAQIARLSDTILDIQSRMSKMMESFQYQIDDIDNQSNSPDTDFKITALCKFANLFNNPVYEMCEKGFDASQIVGPTGSGSGYGGSGYGGSGYGGGDGIQQIRNTESQNGLISKGAGSGIKEDRGSYNVNDSKATCQGSGSCCNQLSPCSMTPPMETDSATPPPTAPTTTPAPTCMHPSTLSME